MIAFHGGLEANKFQGKTSQPSDWYWCSLEAGCIRERERREAISGVQTLRDHDSVAIGLSVANTGYGDIV